jgi:hypothetical protein
LLPSAVTRTPGAIFRRLRHGGPQGLTAPVTYACKAGKRFTATYPCQGRQGVVAPAALTKTLPLARFGSGARYGKAAPRSGARARRHAQGFPGGPYDRCQAR